MTSFRGSAHTCHARGCCRVVKPELLMCFVHWSRVPQIIQAAVYRHYRPGQCDDMRPSRAWHLAADAAIGAVAAREGQPVRMSEITALNEYGYHLRENGGKLELYYSTSKKEDAP